ncbi:MAG: hypothetical protein ACTSYF_02720, partial [Promethearchaeota archaeon]
MSYNDTQGLILNHLLALASNRIIVPGDFHNRVKAVVEMQDNDVSGLVDSLTDFAVETATVEYSVETGNDELTKVLNRWLKTINKDFKGRIPSGITPLAEEYFKERWKYSSFPVLRVSKWEADPKTKLILPSRMFFLDGGSIHAHDKNPDDPGLTLDQYDYYLGNKQEEKYKLKDNVIFSRQNGRWHDEYPNPYLIKRGVYFNWSIIEAIKNNEITVLDQVVPYLLQIKKGTERLAIDKKINYDDKKLAKVIEQFEDLINKSKNANLHMEKKSSTPVRASQFDEEIKHLIPDLEAIFKSTLFEVAERGILSGLGFIDVVDGASSTRRESILNPKPFVQEVESGVKGFKQVLKDLVLLIIEKNKDHPRYMGTSLEIVSTPIKGFMTDKFKERMRQLWDRGLLSSKTTTELIAEVDFEIEVQRREKEAKTGTDLVMYPHITENKEDKGFDIVSSNSDDDDIPDGKKDKIEKKNFDKASLINPLAEEMELIGSPYESVKDLPKSVTERISGIDKRRAWLKIFNSAYNYYNGKLGDTKRAEALAFATANEKIKKVKIK